MKENRLDKMLILFLCVCLSLVAFGCSSDSSDDRDSGEETQAESPGAVSVQTDNQEDRDGSSLEEAEGETAFTDFTYYNYASMDNVLAALISAMNEEEIDRYDAESASQDLMRTFLYAYVNLFDQDSFEQTEYQGAEYSVYVCVDDQYVEELLQAVGLPDLAGDALETDENLLIRQGDTWLIAVGEPEPVTVDYSGFENDEFQESDFYSYDYQVNDMDGDGSEEDIGIVQARFQESSSADSGIVLTYLAITEY